MNWVQRRTGQLILGGVLAGAVLLCPRPAGAANVAATDKLVQEAEAFERKGEWEKAGEIYLQILRRDKNSAATRHKLQMCARHIQLAARHRDHVYRNRVRELSASQALNAYLDALGKLQANYVDRDKIGVTALFRHGLDEFGFALTDATFRQTHIPDARTDDVAAFLTRIKEEWGKQTFRQAAPARQAVRDVAVQAQQAFGLKVAFTVMEFVCGACNALDEQTGYLPPNEEAASLTGQLTAHGALVRDSADGHYYVEKVNGETWAAGVLSEGDRVRLRRGDGDKEDNALLVEVEILGRDGAADRVVRVPAVVQSVFITRIPAMDGIAIVQITGFHKSTPQEFSAKLDFLKAQGMKALVVDLRGNPGGLFASGVQVAERLLPEGIIVTTQGQAGPFNRTYSSMSGLGALDMPLYVLTDNDTASAAEVVAGALKENNRAMLIGQPTYGKGTMQQVLQLAAGGVRITLARFYTPTGQPYQGVGVTPHILESAHPDKVAIEQARQGLMMRP